MGALRTSHLAVVERYGNHDGGHRAASEPYEAGWAAEAVWFLRVEHLDGDVRVVTEISPDGTRWVAHGAELELTATGLVALRVASPFAGWLRLATSGSGVADYVLYLHLKS